MGLDYLCCDHYPEYGVCVLWWGWAGVVTSNWHTHNVTLNTVNGIYFDIVIEIHQGALDARRASKKAATGQMPRERVYLHVRKET